MTRRPVASGPEDLKLAVYKVIETAGDMTAGERLSFRDNDPVAGSEFEEMATLFLQMHQLVAELAPSFPARPLPVLIPGVRQSGRAPEALHILCARTQALVDRTGNFSRPLRP